MLTKIYPFGAAPLVILILALISGVVCAVTQFGRSQEKPDLVLAIFAKNHEASYQVAIAEFEAKHNVKIQLQVVQVQALQSRLQSALQTGSDVPDLVEMLEGSIGYFSRGPLENVGFIDLTERLHAEGLYHKIVESRYSLWSSRERIFALPHDVHPVGLVYRRDLIEELGIDVTKLVTWDDFVSMGRAISKDMNGDGVIDRYAIDFSVADVSSIMILAAQRGIDLFDPLGNLTMDDVAMVDVITWYVQQTEGRERIAYSAGAGQNFAKAMQDGLVLFYFCPDWKAAQLTMDMPYMSGKLALMPLPVWEEGGRRTSTSGGSGLAITKRCAKPKLAWEFAKHLYLNNDDLGKHFRETLLIPPFKDAWNMPEFHEKNEFFSGIALGEFYAELAVETPPRNANAYYDLAAGKLLETYLSAASYYKTNGNDGLRQYIQNSLTDKAGYVRSVIKRNIFLSPREEKQS